ncbi:MAG: dialkylresorcinol condensing enzyme, partial [Campylobacteraceae bacterium]|nr:dialkylresorcinol condensing enzyme [Campylobacteraceae bacterium]
MPHKKVLVVHYSQSGQLDEALKYCIAPLLNDKNISVADLSLKPCEEFPFPWSVLDFLSVFPESVYCDKIALEPFNIDKNEEFDLIILAYQVWFLSPSLPMSSFLQSTEASVWLNGKSVITFIACRNMWLMAQEKMKRMISQNGGVLCDNIVLTDGGNALETFITTPRWLLTGKKEKFWFFSAAGVKKSDMQGSVRF